MVDPRRQETTEDEPAGSEEQQAVEGLSGEVQQEAAGLGTLAARIRRRVALTAHETRFRVRRAQNTTRRTVILRPNLGGLEPAQIRRFARRVAAEARAMQPQLSRPAAQPQAASWGGSLDMTLPGGGASARSGELGAGSAIKPGTFTAGQVIPPMSGPPQRPPSSGAAQPGIRAAAKSGANQPGTARQQPQRRSQGRAVPPKSRLFSRIEEVRPGGGSSPSEQGQTAEEETGDEEGDSAAPFARQGTERTAGLDVPADVPSTAQKRTPAPARLEALGPRVERRGTQPPSPAAPARVESETSAAHPSAGERALPVRGAGPVHPAAQTPHIQRAPEETLPGSEMPQPLSTLSEDRPDMAVAQEGQDESGIEAKVGPLVPPRVGWFKPGETPSATRPTVAPVPRPEPRAPSSAAPLPAARLSGPQEGPDAVSEGTAGPEPEPGTLAGVPEHPVVRRALDEPETEDRPVPAPRVGWFEHTTLEARPARDVIPPSLPSAPDVGTVVRRSMSTPERAKVERPTESEDAPVDRAQAHAAPAVPPEEMTRPDVRSAAGPETGVQESAPSVSSDRTIVQRAPEERPGEAPVIRPDRPTPQPDAYAKESSESTIVPGAPSPTHPVPVQRAPAQDGQMPVVRPSSPIPQSEAHAEENGGPLEGRAEGSSETMAAPGLLPPAHPMPAQRMPEEQPGEMPVVRPSGPPPQPEAQAEDSSELAAAPGALLPAHPTPVQRAPEEQPGEMPVVRPSGPTPRPEGRAESSEGTAAIQGASQSRARSPLQRAAAGQPGGGPLIPPPHPTPQAAQAGEHVEPAVPDAAPSPLQRTRVQRAPDAPSGEAANGTALDRTVSPVRAAEGAVSQPRPGDEPTASDLLVLPRLRWFEKGDLEPVQASGADVHRPGAPLPPGRALPAVRPGVPSIQRAPDGQRGLSAAPVGRQETGTDQKPAGQAPLPAARRLMPALRPARRAGHRPLPGVLQDGQFGSGSREPDRVQAAPETVGQVGPLPVAAPGADDLPLAQIAAPDEGAAGSAEGEMPLRDHILSQARARAQTSIHHAPGSPQRRIERARSWRQLWRARHKNSTTSGPHVERRPFGAEAADLDLGAPPTQVHAVPELPAGVIAGLQRSPDAGPAGQPAEPGLGALERELPLRSAPQAAAGQEKETSDRAPAAGAGRTGSAGGARPAHPGPKDTPRTTEQWDVVVRRSLEDEPSLTQEGTVDKSKEPDLARLAQQIYPLIKRMLAIERERRPYR